ncbi:unnamed protein product [Cuscuta campestris]|uniref:Uncharacterized protein n=1 Tax=Cuscuta campestris TaxID=132261 RepID=A0A484LZ26_9ASTE|nr:unnamed protein product [Cuscuta campestris]
MAPPNLQQNKPSAAVPHLPPSVRSHHSPRKRFLDGSPSNSASFESTWLDQLPKRITRGQPNLSDCHGCRTRINPSIPKDRLRTLDSYWRIVLLCKKCFNLVSSARICAYCYNETLNLDCFSCSLCARCIHKSCVLRYDHSSPWSYSLKEREKESDFSVCIDCWVPKSLKNSKSYSSVDKAVLRSRATWNRSKISLNDYDATPLEKSANGSSSESNKKILVSQKEEKKALGKTVPVNGEMEMTHYVLGLAADNEANDNNRRLMARNSINCSSSSDADSVTKNMDNAGLGFEFHFCKNASPHISKSSHLENKNNIPIPNVRECFNVVSETMEYGNTFKCNEGGEIVVYKRTRLRERCDLRISEGSVCVRDKEVSSFGLSKNGNKLRTYMRTRLKRKALHVNETNNVFFSVDERCNFGNDTRVISESQSIQQGDFLQQSLPCQVSIPSRDKCDQDVTVETERGNTKEDLYMCKYSRRCRVSKPVAHHETSMHGDTLTQGLSLHEVKCDGKVTLQNKSCNSSKDRYSLKYSKRHTGLLPAPKTIAVKLDNETGMHGDALSHELPLNEVMDPLQEVIDHCQVKCDDMVTSQYESCNGKEGCYSFKYSKRHVNNPNLQNDTSDTDVRYLIKYSKRHTSPLPASKIRSLNLDHETDMRGDSMSHELPLNEVIDPYQVKCDDKVTSQTESCNEEGRYSVKYFKRRTGKVNLQKDNINMDAAYLESYSRRHTGPLSECKTRPAKLDHETGMHGDALSHELPLSEAMGPCLAKCDKVTSQHESCNEEDRYSLGYSKMYIDKANLQKDNSNIDVRYIIKYSKRHADPKKELEHQCA